MSVRECLSSRFAQIEAAIAELGSTFDSHAFIEQYAHMNEMDYVAMLAANNRVGVFQMVHSEMAKFLSQNQEQLRIRKTDRKNDSKNIFGEASPAEVWIKE
jgi:hypothetical protein